MSIDGLSAGVDGIGGKGIRPPSRSRPVAGTRERPAEKKPPRRDRDGSGKRPGGTEPEEGHIDERV